MTIEDFIPGELYKADGQDWAVYLWDGKQGKILDSNNRHYIGAICDLSNEYEGCSWVWLHMDETEKVKLL